MNGLDLLVKLKQLDPLIEVVMVTGQGSIESAVEAMKRGAYHYVTKPVRLTELELVARRALERTRLARQNQIYREHQRRRRGGAAEVVAESASMKRLLAQAEQLAASDTPLLVLGETGTGKEIVAEFIHRHSARRDRELVVVNCAALTESILDAELFGHEKGAFTGATESRPGMVELADGGTLLLDEIGDMPPAGQVRLLRFLEKSVFRRVGSAREQSVDVRVVAATHRDLAKAVSTGAFREDLYHRLDVFQLRIPPLRERPEDILPLAASVLARLSRGAPRPLTEAGREALLAYSWPGNVRELVHAVERAFLMAGMAGSDEIGPEHFCLQVAGAAPAGALVSIDEAVRRHVRFVLDRVDGNRARAAEILGVSERHLYRLLQQDGQDAVTPMS
jgi:DNA-binding NtrC family response regulator